MIVQPVPRRLHSVGPRACALLALLGVLATCRSVPHSELSSFRYLVTFNPIDVGLGPQAALCIAVDPGDQHGIWWWHPGASACASRSSSIMKAMDAAVIRSAPRGPVEARFRLQTHSTSRPVVDVRLTIGGGQMQSAAGAPVEVRGRMTLEVPELPTRGRTPR